MSVSFKLRTVKKEGEEELKREIERQKEILQLQQGKAE